MAPLLPTLAAQARSIFSSAITTRSQAAQATSDHISRLGPLAVRAILLGRDDGGDGQDKNPDPQLDPSLGVTDPHDINNTFIFVLFGLLGAAFVVTGIWFFFWAKNGGFHFKENDWEEYKSTVLRRKGPNGTLLSGATPSTDLGGGSVYKDVDDGRTEYTGGLTQMTGDTGDTMSTLTGITAGASDIAGRERRRRQREKKEREHEKKRDRKMKKKEGRRKVGEDGVLVDEEAEEAAKRNLRAYRSERPARVGGLNRAADGSEWDGSTNPEMSTVSGSELLLNNRQSTPTSTPTKDKDKRRSRSHHHEEESEITATASEVTASTNDTQSHSQSARKAGGIRKVYSTADRTEARRLAAEKKSQHHHQSSHGHHYAASSSASSASSSYTNTNTNTPTTHSLRRDYSRQRAGLRTGPGGAAAATAGSTIAEEAEEQQDTSAPLIGTGRYLPAPDRNPAPAKSTVSWAQESDIADGSDLGTKSYRHYIPGISSSANGSGAEEGGERDKDEMRERRRWRDAQRQRRG
ncbi:hypothetical protein F4777DRAFT_427582 [Nemania sp. FL0916]|nr:hypothetical protein F4777DRAFT_427582 [Nemania sp. FL0916]